MKSQPIGFFDSGVGLLSIFQETKKLLPNQNYVIYSDQKHIPFSDKSQRQLKTYASKALNFLITKHDIQIAVIACNTASVSTLEHLRKKFQIPIVGVVPAIKPAAETTTNDKIAVIATPSTTNSPYLKQLIQKYAKDKKVLKVPCAQLAEAIESQDKKEITLLLRKYLKKVKKFQVDTLVIGCTHYSLVKDEIQEYLGKNVRIIDSAKAIAKRLQKLIPENQKGQKDTEDIFYTTAKSEQFSKAVSAVLKYNIDAKKSA